MLVEVRQRSSICLNFSTRVVVSEKRRRVTYLRQLFNVHNALFVCRFVLFKRHYDKYVALAAKYEEAKGIAYYLEERYHEVKVRCRRIDDFSFVR